MNTRIVTVTVEVTTQHKGPFAIDEDRYLAWLNGEEDNESHLFEFLQSGRDSDWIARNIASEPGEVLLREIADVETL